MKYQILVNSVLTLAVFVACYVSISTHNRLATELKQTEGVNPLGAVPGFARSHEKTSDLRATQPVDTDTIRQMMQVEFAHLLTDLKTLNPSSLKGATPLCEPLKSRLAAPPATEAQIRALNADIARALRNLPSTDRPSLGQHRALLGKIAQLPADQRGPAMREFNRRLND